MIRVRLSSCTYNSAGSLMTTKSKRGAMMGSQGFSRVALSVGRALRVAAVFSALSVGAIHAGATNAASATNAAGTTHTATATNAAGASEVADAAERDDATRVIELIAKKTDVNAAQPDGSTA